MKTNVSMRVCPLPSSLLSLQKSRGSVLGGSRLVGFMQRLANMPQASLHAEILSDNILDAQQAPGFDNWAAGVHKQYTSLGMASPFWVGGSSSLMGLGFSEPWLTVRTRSGQGCTSPALGTIKEGKALHIFPLVITA